MIKPSPRQLKALQSLRGQPDVLEFLQAALSDAKDRLVSQRDAEVFRMLQGQARTLDYILTTINSDTTQQSGKR